MTAPPPPPPAGDRVFAAFCAAGLWPGLGKRTAAELPAAGIVSPDDVSADRLIKLPAGRPAAGRAAVLQLPGRPAHLRGRRDPGRRRARGAAGGRGRRRAGARRRPPAARRPVGAARADRGHARRRRPAGDRRAVRRRPAGHPPRPGDRRAHAADGDPRRAHGAPGRPRGRRAAGRGHRRPRGGVVAAVESGDVLEHEPPEPDGDDPDDPEPDPALRTLSLARYGMAEEAVAEGVARLAASAERIADPASVRSVAKGLDKAQQAAVAQVLGAGRQPAHRRPGHRQEPHRRRRRAAAAGQGHRHRAGRADRPGGEAAGGAHRPPRGRRCTGCSGAQGTTGGFARNEEWPLDADVVVVDEASMLDVELTAALLEACPDGTHLLLVGDPAQLPSIGPGHVLGDLIDSGVVPVTELTTLYRQAEGGAIARLATGGARRRAAAGRLPRPRGGGRAGHRQRRGRAAGGAAGHRLDPAGAGHRPGRRAGRHAGAPRSGRHHRAEQGAEGRS